MQSSLPFTQRAVHLNLLLAQDPEVLDTLFDFLLNLIDKHGGTDMPDPAVLDVR